MVGRAVPCPPQFAQSVPANHPTDAFKTSPPQIAFLQFAANSRLLQAFCGGFCAIWQEMLNKTQEMQSLLVDKYYPACDKSAEISTLYFLKTSGLAGSLNKSNAGRPGM
jgi:hypothetical protein